MIKEPIQYATELKKNKTAWCYICNKKKVQWDEKKKQFICKHCGAVHESMRSCRE